MSQMHAIEIAKRNRAAFGVIWYRAGGRMDAHPFTNPFRKAPNRAPRIAKSLPHTHSALALFIYA